MIQIMSPTQLPPPLNLLAAKDAPARQFKAGETIFIQNAPTTGLYYLIKGKVDLHRTTPEGHSVLIHRARSEDTFAEASLFSEQYHCTATAAMDSLIVECSRAAISARLEQDAPFSLQLLNRFARQLQATRRQVELLSIKAADQRITAALQDGLLIDDINSFAHTIGLTPETVYRTLKQLNTAGIVAKTGRGKYQLLRRQHP